MTDDVAPDVWVGIDDLQCAICTEVLREPVVIECRTRIEGGKCEAVVCAVPCLQTLARTQKARGGIAAGSSGRCVLCRAPWPAYAWRSMTTLGRMASRVRVKCYWNANGCLFEGSPKEVWNHCSRGLCEYERVTCPNSGDGCPVVFKRGDGQSHRLECAYFPCRNRLSRDGCGHTCPLSELDEHEHTCPYGTFACVDLVMRAREKTGLWVEDDVHNNEKWDSLFNGRTGSENAGARDVISLDDGSVECIDD